MATKKRLHLVLLAGGTGSRAGGGRGAPPKQFCVSGRGQLFTVSLRAFLALDGAPQATVRVAGVTIAVAEAWCQNAVQGMEKVQEKHPDQAWQLAPAGETRTGSTWNALRALAAGYTSFAQVAPPAVDDLVAVHDAARPFATTDLLARLVEAATENGAAVPGVPVTDTIVRTDDAGDPAAPAVYLKRELLQAVQTPQVFRWDILYTAHEWAAGEGLDFTDDGGLLAARGHHPVVVPGDVGNWKVTTESDLRRAVDLLK